MKKTLLRLFQSEIIIVTMILALAGVAVYAIGYQRGAIYNEIMWEHGIDAYSSEEEIQSQIENIALYDLNQYTEETKTHLQETVDILKFLKSQKIKYEDVYEYSAEYLNEKTYGAFAYDTTSFLIIFDSILAVLVLIKLVVIDRANGTYVMEFIQKGRREYFTSQMRAYLCIMSIILLFQTEMVLIMGSNYPTKASKVLIYTGNRCMILKSSVVMICNVISLIGFVFATSIMLFFLAKQIDRTLYFIIVSVIGIALLILTCMKLRTISFFSCVGVTFFDALANGNSIIKIAITMLAEILFVCSLGYISYHCCMRKQMCTAAE